MAEPQSNVPQDDPPKVTPIHAREVPEDYSGRDLRDHDFAGRDLSGARFFRSDLRGANLHRAVLEGAEFTGADLRGADLEGVRAARAGFGAARLDDACLFEADLHEATLSQANLTGVDLRATKLDDARLVEVDLSSANVTHASLHGADLTNARVDRAIFNEADLRHARLQGIHGFERAHWIGVDTRDVNFAGAYRLRRHIIDENYLEEFRNQGRLSNAIYWLWWATSDCGRSMSRWCLWILVAVLVFGGLFWAVGADWGDHPTPLSPLYFSVVTLTTLGYGDVTPNSPVSQVIAILEVIVGYLMLGGLLAILANKMARRGE